MTKESKSIHWHGLDPICYVDLPTKYPWEEEKLPTTCATFKNIFGPLNRQDDPEDYWGRDGKNYCSCGHSARDHNLKERGCNVCANIPTNDEELRKVWRGER